PAVARGVDAPDDRPQLRGVRRRPYQPGRGADRTERPAVFLEESGRAGESDVSVGSGLINSAPLGAEAGLKTCATSGLCGLCGFCVDRRCDLLMRARSIPAVRQNKNLVIWLLGH